MIIFLGGSLSVESLGGPIRQQVGTLASQDCEFLVGDARGADRLFQLVLKQKATRVTVFYSGDRPRNNLGNWPAVKVAGAKRGHARHSQKDRSMAERANSGIMVWNGESLGTLTNCLHLALRERVHCHIFHEPTGETVLVEDADGLRTWLKSIGSEKLLSEALGRLRSDVTGDSLLALNLAIKETAEFGPEPLF